MSATGIVVTALIIFLGCWDLIMVLRKGVSSSVSRFLQNAGFRSPVIIFAFAYIVFHLFGQMEPVPQPCIEGPVVVKSDPTLGGEIDLWVKSLLKSTKVEDVCTSAVCP